MSYLPLNGLKPGGRREEGSGEPEEPEIYTSDREQLAGCFVAVIGWYLSQLMT